MEEPNAEKPAPEAASTAAAAPEPAPERRDAEGLPLDREPTIDDVRGGANHFKFAIGCSVVVVVVLAAFWVLRLLLAG
jgi:hypothetical protein